MPTQTFYNLSEEKKARLLQAVHEEFARVPFEQVSINQIVQTAGISRGSFYQYFEDKDDLFFYCVQGGMQLLQQHILQSMAQSGGDVFVVVEQTLQYLVGLSQSVGAPLMKHFIQQLHNSTDERLRPERHLQKTQAQKHPFLAMINTDVLDLRHPHDLEHILDILANELRWSIGKIYLFSMPPEQVTAEFHTRLEILRRGMAQTTEDSHVI